MKKQIFNLLVSFICLGHLQATGFAGGAGTSDSPYQVATADQLNNVRNHLSAYFIQTADIDLGLVENWEPIGGNGFDAKFIGHYDGNNKEIRNMTIVREGIANVGFFGHIGMSGNSATTIINVRLVNANVTGGRGTGALVGRVTGNQNTRIEYCSATGSVKGDAATGGLVGSNNSHKNNTAVAESFRPVIFACWANVSVSARAEAPNDDMIKFGGLVGCNQKGLISNSYARGSVTVEREHANRIGGLAGCVEFRGVVINSYSTGTVTVHTSATNVGGLLGMKGEGTNMGTISGCYYSSSSNHPDNDLGDRLTVDALKIPTNLSGWDFSNIWDVDLNMNDGFPYQGKTSAAATQWLWKGGMSGNENKWEHDGNWTDSNNNILTGYPGRGSTINATITIPVSSNQPVLPTSIEGFIIYNLTLHNGAIVEIPSGVSLTITGSIIRPETGTVPEIKGEGDLILSGVFLQQIPELKIENLTIINLNNVILEGNLHIGGLLKMESGLLDLNGFEIDLSDTGSLSEKDEENYSSRVFGTSGTILTTRPFDQINSANLGITLTSTGTNPGSTTIRRGHSSLPGLNNSKSILRWFDIVPAVNSGLNVSMVFSYAKGDLEFSGEEPSFSLFKKPSAGDSTTWVMVEAVLNASARTLTATGIESFSTWTAANASIPMPIILFSFEGKPVNDVVELSWVTAAEINNDYFTIERSSNGVDFEPIDYVEGSGTISYSKRYMLTDEQPLCGISYYRLKQTDFNGEYEFFKPISIFRDASSLADFRVYPNPSNGQFKIYTGGDRDAQYHIMDMQGRVVASGTAEGGRVNVIYLPHLSQGLYTVVLNADEVTAKKIQIF